MPYDEWVCLSLLLVLFLFLKVQTANDFAYVVLIYKLMIE